MEASLFIEQAEQSQASHAKARRVVSRELLLGIYLIAPVCLALLLVDKFVFSGHLRSTTNIPSLIVILYSFASVPHFMASFITFCDKEYLQIYRTRMLVGLPIICVCAYFLASLGVQYLDPILRTMSFLHLMTQQVGVSGLVLGARARWFVAWKWTMIISGILIGNTLLTEGHLPFLTRAFTLGLIACGILIALVLSHLVARESKSGVGKKYIWANWGWLATLALASWQNYFFIAHVIGRTVHDITAMILYAIHDENRNSEKPNNFVYRFLKPLQLSAIWLSPILGLCLTFAFGCWDVAFTVIIALYATHYYLDYFMWKPKGPHRKQL